MAATVGLQFQGSQHATILIGLAALVTALLLGLAVADLLARRRRRAAIAAAAALTPAVLSPMMLIDAARRYRRGDSAGGRASYTAAIGTAAALIAAVGVAAWAGATALTWLTATVAMQVVVAVGVFYAGAFQRLGSARFSVLMALRCAAILALLAVLLKPVIIASPSAADAQGVLAVLVDRSASMATTDQDLPDRHSQAVQSLLTQQARIEQHFRPHWIAFAAGPQRVANAADLSALGPHGEGTDRTDVAAAIRAAVGGGGENLQAILMVTDGSDNAEQDLAEIAADAPVPIYAVGVGSTTESDSARRNAAVIGVEAPLVASPAVAVTIVPSVQLINLPRRELTAQLTQPDSPTPLDAQPLWTDQTDAVETAALTWTPSARATPAGDAPSPVAVLTVKVPPAVGEALTDDNTLDLHVLIAHADIRVLYIEGAIRPEYKYLRRHLDSDPDIELVSLVQVSQGRFWARGAAGGKTLAGLPRTASDFDLFDVIILGDLDSQAFSSGQLKQLAAFVERGGGLVMLGGQHSFGPGGYGGTAVEAALPVMVGSRSQGQYPAPLAMQLTSAGQAHPIFEGLEAFFAGPERAATAEPALPTLRGCVGLARAKSTAAVLAIHPDQTNDAGPLVILAAHACGRGRSVAMAADTTWQWYLPGQALGAESPYRRFWSQLVRWLAHADTRSRGDSAAVVFRLQRTYQPYGQPVQVLAAAVTGTDDPDAAIKAECELIRVEDDQVVVGATMDASADGRFSAELKGPAPGNYRLRVIVRDAGGRQLGADELPLTVAQQPAELTRLARNEQLLGGLADGTGGRYADLADLPDMLDALIAQAAPARAPARTIALHHFPILFVLFVAALTVEWILRRRWELT